jgi:nucleoside-diphosphate-sugar epimerase
MRILLAGGTGVIGSRLLPELVAAGHEVVATTRREDRLAFLSSLGVRGVLLDVRDAVWVAATLAEAAPDLVLHQLTDLSGNDREANARVRREGTANLVAGATAAGVDRMIVQSITWVFPDGDTPATEDDPIVPGTAVDVMEGLARCLPRATVLRYGILYGPGTWYAPGGLIAAAVSARQVQANPAITSFVHVDDEPAPATEWLPVYATGIGAPAPRTAPLPEGAPVGRAVSNAKARAAGWTPAHPSWRAGFSRPGG